jgi:hypothetical protein
MTAPVQPKLIHSALTTPENVAIPEQLSGLLYRGISSGLLYRGIRMSTEAPDALPIVICPGCEEPMQPTNATPATRQLDDVIYVCPKCRTEIKRMLKRT